MFYLISILCTVFLATGSLASDKSKDDFWRLQRKGTNFFNQRERIERFDAAKKMGLTFVRLTPTKWQSKVGGKGKFLFGSFDNYKGLVEEDFQSLKAYLDYAAKIDLKVVITFLSVPGRVWRQHNGRKNDVRIWKESKYRTQLASFWRDLAKRLKDHPAVVGYNLVNEPSPEHADPAITDWYTDDHRKWCEKVAGTSLDLNKFYEEIITQIRTVDKHTSIVIDSGYMGVPLSTLCFRRLNDPNVLYSFHMYEPYEYALGNRRNGNKYSYPGAIPVGDAGLDKPQWNRKQLEKFLGQIRGWQIERGIKSHEVLVGEFGVLRRNKGAALFLTDIISLFNQYKWHWAFYSFREDTWAEVDYELGTRPLGAKYWEEEGKGVDPYDLRLPLYRKNPIMSAIQSGL